MRYEGQIYRPFSEADSYLLQCTIGCSHNQCTFCGMYKDRKYRVRSLEEIRIDIAMAKEQLCDARKVFLCDGDAVAMDTPVLIEILKSLYGAFPSLRHVGTYVGPQSTLSKSLSELSALRAAGLTKVYLGVETGDDRLLAEIKKGVNAQQMLKAGQNLVNAGFNLSSMVMLGIAGTGERSREHALATAEITNAMRPSYIAALTYTPVPHTPLYSKVAQGRFILPDPFETLAEMKVMIENITIAPIKFIGAHASNYLPVSGTLQKDRAGMLCAIQSVLDSRDMSALRPEHRRGL